MHRVSWRGAGRLLKGARLTCRGLLWCWKAELHCGLIRPLWPNLFAKVLREKATQHLRDSGASKHCRGPLHPVFSKVTRHFWPSLEGAPHHYLAQSLGILDTLVVFAKGVPTMWALTLTKINPSFLEVENLSITYEAHYKASAVSPS